MPGPLACPGRPALPADQDGNALAGGRRACRAALQRPLWSHTFLIWQVATREAILARIDDDSASLAVVITESSMLHVTMPSPEDAEGIRLEIGISRPYLGHISAISRPYLGHIYIGNPTRDLAMNVSFKKLGVVLKNHSINLASVKKSHSSPCFLRFCAPSPEDVARLLSAVADVAAVFRRVFRSESAPLLRSFSRSFGHCLRRQQCTLQGTAHHVLRRSGGSHGDVGNGRQQTSNILWRRGTKA